MFTFQFAFSLPPTELHLSPSRRPLRLPVQAVTTKHHNLVFHKQRVSHGSASRQSERGPTAGLQPGHFPASSHGAEPASCGAPGPVTRAPILSTRAPPPTSSAPNTVTVEGLLHRVTLGAHTCHPWQPSAPMFLRTNRRSRRAPEVPYPPAAGSPPRAAPVRQVMGASQHRSRTVVNVPGP